jgi:hypothetical protein
MTTEAQQTRTEHITIEPMPARERMTAADVARWLEYAQHEPREYSGRCMYGERCLAVTTDSASEAATVILDVLQACAENGDVDDVKEAIALLRGSRTDAMGRGVVVYWPDIKWADCGIEPEAEEDLDDGIGEREYGRTSVRGDREDFHSDG